MSFHFYINKNINVTYKGLLSHIEDSNVRIAYDEDFDYNMSITGYAKFYIPNESTRGVSLNLDNGVFDVGIYILASKEDYLLAANIARAIAYLTDAKIEPEYEDKPISIRKFNRKYNDIWAEESKTFGLNVVKYMIREKNDTLTIGSCMRNYFIGPSLIKHLTGDNPSKELFYERMTASIKRVQFMDESRIRIPNRFEITEKDDSKWEYIVLIPEIEQMLVKTEFIVLHSRAEGFVKIPFEEFKQMAIEIGRRLDEEQFILPAFSKSEFKMLMKKFGEKTLES